jgi:hypothetical protein
MTAPSSAKENQERAAIMKAEAQRREQEQPTTMHGFAMAELAQPRGRFGEAEGKQFVVGSTPIAYPKLPASSPWAHDPVPNEEPLGYSVDDLEPPAGIFAVSRPAATGPTSDAPSFAEGDEQRGVGPLSSDEEDALG